MTRISSFLSLLLLGAFTLTFTACDEDDPSMDAEEAMLSMMFEYQVDGAAFTPGEVYNINGTDVKIDIAHFYVGGIELMPEEGDAVVLEDKYLLVKPQSGMQELASVNTGHYHMLRFFVGVDPETNDQSEDDFTSRDADDPLGIQNPSMHWGWNAGYRFLRIDGEVDTDGDGTMDESMAFHLGNDEMLQNVQLMAHKDVEKDGSNMLHIRFDLAALFDGLDLSTDYSTHTNNDPELAAAVRDNIPGAMQMAH